MRTQTNGDITITYPDLICFCFSPCYLSVTGADAYTTLSVRLYSGAMRYDVTAAIYGGEARLYLSRYMQLLATNQRFSGCVMQTTLSDGTNTLAFTDVTFSCIWGAIEPVKRIGSVGAYAYDADAVAFVRRVRWFNQFPFAVSVLTEQGATYQFRYDSNGYGTEMTAPNNGYIDITPATETFRNAERFAVIKVVGSGDAAASVFDDTFDYTFQNVASGTSLTRLIVDTSTCGYYLRWIDTYGQLQYFLFARGTRSLKVTDGDSVETDIEYSGINYGGGRRVVAKVREKSVKCAAVNLTQEEAEYVESVASAVVCDLYLGKQQDSTEIWIPVNVTGGTFTTSEKKGLQDFEISIDIPTAEAQRL